MFLVVLGLAGLMHAQSSTSSMQDSAQKMTVTGTVCRASCVRSAGNNTSSCDPLCTDQTGDTVLVDDQGNIKKIVNQDICSSHMGKHVKMTAMPMQNEHSDMIKISEVYDLY
jgi:hypothetical protein